MDSKEFVDLGKRNIRPISLGTLGILLLIGGIFHAYSSRSSEPDLVFQEIKTEDKSVEKEIDVSGAVINPGVYKLANGSRMVDALASAGGLSSEADRDYVDKNINLAAKVSDGLKIYIPRVGEDILFQSQSVGGDIGGSSGGQVLNINLASSTDLEALPGVGEVTAQKIIDGRPYASIKDLKFKEIVGDGTYEKIKDQIAAN